MARRRGMPPSAWTHARTPQHAHDARALARHRRGWGQVTQPWHHGTHHLCRRVRVRPQWQARQPSAVEYLYLPAPERSTLALPTPPVLTPARPPTPVVIAGLAHFGGAKRITPEQVAMVLNTWGPICLGANEGEDEAAQKQVRRYTFAAARAVLLRQRMMTHGPALWGGGRGWGRGEGASAHKGEASQDSPSAGSLVYVTCAIQHGSPRTRTQPRAPGCCRPAVILHRCTADPEPRGAHGGAEGRGRGRGRRRRGARGRRGRR